MDQEDAKAGLRRTMRATLAAMPAPSETEISSLAAHFFSAETFAEAPLLVGFLPIQREPDIRPILQRWLDSGRQLLIPAFDNQTGLYALAMTDTLDERSLVKGRFGIPEPRAEIPKLLPPYAFDRGTVWLIPGLAFTPSGIRLGRGGGFYDRLLQNAPGIRVGILHTCQLVDSLPSLPHDMRMDFLLTEAGILKCNLKHCKHLQ